MSQVSNVEKISTLVLEGKEYTVLRFKHEGTRYYGTIRSMYITDGKLNTTLTGLQLSMGLTLEIAIERRREQIQTNKELIIKFNTMKTDIESQINILENGHCPNTDKLNELVQQLELITTAIQQMEV